MHSVSITELTKDFGCKGSSFETLSAHHGGGHNFNDLWSKTDKNQEERQ